ncbi:TetR/AcrR family transcriptional regulator [Actinomadura meridiana]|uniref:TetR/AcrR family transcriptional regulator n=1 Tax=Actinomadura meridiana TaxID=559626 RepID=UPI0031E61F40
MTAQKDRDTRERIIRTAARLLSEAGGEPVSTRAVCAAAGIGAPTLYHHFGDKKGLFDAVAAYGFERYVAAKRAQVGTGDPVDDLRRGWDVHVEYGRTNPEFYSLMYGQPGKTSPAAEEAHAILVELIDAIARAGRLRVPADTAVQMVGAAGVGVTLALISGTNDDLSTRTREAVITAITVPHKEAQNGTPSPAARAVALRAALRADPPPGLTPTEAALLGEWLDRVAGAAS